MKAGPVVKGECVYEGGLGFLGFLGNGGRSRGGDVGRVEKEQGRRENAVAGWARKTGCTVLVQTWGRGS
uniref:Uncharacterized protein n=1 Tax=Tanacetum cinerariifolium TaxID=118510 RepID=A0A699KK03_TANCI|nr:hypothetical protein [Tanacetum cinerariifolium]